MTITWLTDPAGLAEPAQMDGTAKETWADDKISCSVQLRCPWADRYAVLSNLLRYAPAWPYHTDPIAYAVNGSIANATGASIDNGSGLDYDEALIDVGFESGTRKTSDTGEVTVYDESIDTNAEFLTLPSDGFYWDNTQTTAIKKEEAPGRLELGLDYVVTIYNLTSIPTSVLTLRGKSNSVAITSPSLGLTFDIETLLFNPPKITRKIALGADNFFTLQLRYSHKQSGWNKFWRPQKSGGPDYVSMYTAAGAEYKNFAPASFAGLVP